MFLRKKREGGCGACGDEIVRLRTRADRVFLRARPAALRTWTGDASLTSSAESMSTYAGWMDATDEHPRGGLKTGWSGTHVVLCRGGLELFCGIITRVCVWGVEGEEE